MAWQLIQSLNNPRIYEWLLEDCEIDEETEAISPPSNLQENLDLFIKLLASIPEEADLGSEFKPVTNLYLWNKRIDVTPLKELTQLTRLNLWDIPLVFIRAQIKQLEKALPECRIT